MAMTKKEREAHEAALLEARTLGALRWTTKVERDVPIPISCSNVISSGWEFNAHSMRVYPAWSLPSSHGDGEPPEAGKRHYIGSQGGRALFSTKARALAALRSEMERVYANRLSIIDKQIAEEAQQEKV